MKNNVIWYLDFFSTIIAYVGGSLLIFNRLLKYNLVCINRGKSTNNFLLLLFFQRRNNSNFFWGLYNYAYFSSMCLRLKHVVKHLDIPSK